MIDLIQFKGEQFELGYKETIVITILKTLKEIKNQEIIILQGGKDNRKITENKKVDILLYPEKGQHKDFMHHRNSGLNQVLLKLMKKNNITYGINLSELINNKNKKSLMGRISQNIKLARKYKVKMMAASFANNKYEMRNPNDIQALLKELGMTPKEAKDALNWEKNKNNKIKIIK